VLYAAAALVKSFIALRQGRRKAYYRFLLLKIEICFFFNIKFFSFYEFCIKNVLKSLNGDMYMTAKEKWGYFFIYETNDKNIIESQKKITGNTPLITYYYSENDGAVYVRRGPEREIILKIDNKVVTADKLKFIMTKISFPKKIEEELKRMIKSKNIQSISFPDTDK